MTLCSRCHRDKHGGIMLPNGWTCGACLRPAEAKNYRPTVNLARRGRP